MMVPAICIPCLTIFLNGCLFSLDLCDINEECYDDNAFGSCQKLFSKDSYRHLLGSSTIKLLEGELMRLFAGGYHWKDEYTQCVVQNILYANRHGISYDPGLCSRIMKMTIPDVPAEIFSDLQMTNPKQLAFIKFTPPHEAGDSIVYANEEFIPQDVEIGSEINEEVATPRNQLREKKSKPDFIPDYVAATSNINKEALLRRLLEITQDTEQMLEHRGDFASRLPSDEVPIFSTDLSSDLSRRPVFTEGGIDWILAEREEEDDEEEEEEVKDEEEEDKKDDDNDDRIYVKKGSDTPLLSKVKVKAAEEEKERKFKMPSDGKSTINEDEDNDGPTMMQGVASSDGNTLDDVDDYNFHFNWRHINPIVEDMNNYFFQSRIPIPSRKAGSNIERQEETDYLEDSFRAVLPTNAEERERKSSTFQRSMRYDTKKPGPTYFFHDDEDGVSYEDEEDEIAKIYNNFLSGNNNKEKSFLPRLMSSSHKGQLQALLGQTITAHKTTPTEEIQEEDKLKELIRMKYLPPKPHDKSETESSEDSVKRTFVHQSRQSQPETFEYAAHDPKTKASKGQSEGATTRAPMSDLYTVDSNYVYLTLKETDSPPEAIEKIVRFLEKLLLLPSRTFSDIRSKGNQVTFKVNQNIHGLNASDVALKAEDLAPEIQSHTHFSIQSAGIGDKVKYEVVSKNYDKKLHTLTIVLCGSVVGVILAVAVAYFVQRHARSKKKLQNITKPDTEASQDYEDLCRLRMASKTTENAERIGEHTSFSPKKVRTLSQTEAQASLSSHSSTSSWNEEPVTSNMDISTGHMILSYMEDHLKNKDRLDREWEALCAYEAEPCATTTSTLTQNVKKNRYPDVLPYDHSRVTLNEVTNVSSSDYINASSITDHDPRNPAYIATQGPLPHTAADFWQMIWEQGSVVMVMLTRLMENGVAMCHRHWPEDGSEVYHIYEVHLVSEHIWCDDYLVRNFYLKNLKTGETRTVTQFHFLSWPDNGVPNSTKALLEFRRKVNKSYRGRSCPIIVHCSDGIGRAGTYILIDMVLNRMAKGAKEIDIAATLEHVRDQRAGMVKTKTQFEFVLMAIAEEVHAILKALSQ